MKLIAKVRTLLVVACLIVAVLAVSVFARHHATSHVFDTSLVLNLVGVVLAAVAILLTLWQRLALASVGQQDGIQKSTSRLAIGAAILYVAVGTLALFMSVWLGLSEGVSAAALGLAYLGFALNFYLFAFDVSERLSPPVAGSSAFPSARGITLVTTTIICANSATVASSSPILVSEDGDV